MNCVKGDLAIVVKSFAGNEGKVMRVLRFVGEAGHGWVGSDWWETDTVTTSSEGVKNTLFPDSFLRPIRDNPGNEDFVTKARKTLPRKKPVTGPVSINARGEPA